MVEKLKSISRRIHWSLLLKAAVFALAWAWLPFWLFFLIALYLYFAPIARAGKLAVPFALLIVLSFIQPVGLAAALVLGALFMGILLIKDLILIDRRTAHELLALGLSFFLFRDFYMRFNEGAGGGALWMSLAVALVFGLILGNFVNNALEGAPPAAVPPAAPLARTKRAALWLSTMLMWQVLVAGLFLPLDFIYQSVIVFLVAILLIDLVPDYLLGALSREKTLTAGTAVFTLFVIVLGSARWGL